MQNELKGLTKIELEKKLRDAKKKKWSIFR